MRVWWKAFLVMTGLVFGASVLWVWAAPLTGPVGRNVVMTEPNTVDIGGPVKGNLFTCHQQGADPAPPAAGDWNFYCKAGGFFQRDSAGNITGPFGTGGGGGAGTGITAVRVATTANITLSGTQTIDGVASIGASGELVLVKDQSTATQNGIYVASSGAWTRSTSFDTSGEFVPGFPVYVQSGTANGGTSWNFSTVGAFTLGTSTVSFTRTGPGGFGEVLVNKSTVATSVANGYLGTDANGRAAYNRVGSGAVHAALSAGTTITPSALFVGIEGSGGPVNLTSNPQIAPGVPYQMATFFGTHPTNTVQVNNGNGVRLCGNTGSVLVGLDRENLEFYYDTSASAWIEVGCKGLQRVANVGRTIVATEANPWKICNAAGTSCKSQFVDSVSGNPTEVNTCLGTTCLNSTIGPLPVGGKARVLNNAGAEIFVVNENGTISGLSFGKAFFAGWGNSSKGCSSGGDVAYTVPMGQSFYALAPGNVAIPASRGGTIKELYVRAASGTTVPAGQTLAVTINKAGSDTGVTCSITSTTTTCNDTTHTAAVSAGDPIAMKANCSGGGTVTADLFMWSFNIE